MLAVKGFSRLFTNEKLLNISNIQKKNIQLVLTSSSLPGPGDEGLVPWLKALGPDISGLRGTSRGGAEVGSGAATDGTSHSLHNTRSHRTAPGRCHEAAATFTKQRLFY